MYVAPLCDSVALSSRSRVLLGLVSERDANQQIDLRCDVLSLGALLELGSRLWRGGPSIVAHVIDTNEASHGGSGADGYDGVSAFRWRECFWEAMRLDARLKTDDAIGLIECEPLATRQGCAGYTGTC